MFATRRNNRREDQRDTGTAVDHSVDKEKKDGNKRGGQTTDRLSHRDEKRDMIYCGQDGETAVDRITEKRKKLQPSRERFEWTGKTKIKEENQKRKEGPSEKGAR